MRTSALALACIAVVLALPAAAADLPKRKSGLWEVKTDALNGDKAGGQTMQMCIDEKTDNAIQHQTAGVGRDACTRQDVRQEAGRTVVDSVCTFGNSKATTHSVFTGSFDSKYRVETKTSYEPPLMGIKEGATVIDARWIGPCKADQKPGDMILGNGMKINVNDVHRK